jgi:hypothetical protein
MPPKGLLIRVCLAVGLCALALVIVKHALGLSTLVFLVIAGFACLLISAAAAMSASQVTAHEIIDFVIHRGSGSGRGGAGGEHGSRSPTPGSEAAQTSKPGSPEYDEAHEAVA